MVKESTKRLWLGKHRGRNAAVFVVIAVLLGLLIGFGFPALVDAAWSKEQPTVSTTSTEKERVCGPANEVECKKYVKAFKAGKTGRSHGLPVKKLFKSPQVARKVWVNKITARIKNACLSTAVGKVTEDTATICRQADRRLCDRCLAYELYRDMVQNASCSGRGNLDAVHDHLCAARYPGTGPRLTKRQVQIGGTAILCAGNVAIAARGGAGLLAGLFGSAACGWALWEAVDPD